MTHSEIEQELHRRAESFLSQKHLLVNYNRIYRRVAYPLPVRCFELLKYPMPEGSDYPWATWLVFALEERIYSLGWAGEWFGAEAVREAVRRDIIALAEWPEYRQYKTSPDLCFGHTARILWTAYKNWKWLDTEVRTGIEAAFRRMVDDALPAFEKHFADIHTPQNIFAQPNPSKYFHNIALIGSVGLSFAAHGVGHLCAESVDMRLQMIVASMLDHRRDGFSEAVGYDGFVMDFLADWMKVLPPEKRDKIVEHPRFDDLLDESIALAAPGAALDVAELSDVEPIQMPHHASAHAKLLRLRPNPFAAWYLSRCKLERLRADALAALHAGSSVNTWKTPQAGALNAHYALVLRSGWESDDLVVAMGHSSCNMGHIHHDNGSIVVGTGGAWLLADPGYQQYQPTPEQEFTLGVTAHNTPIINDQAQTIKAPHNHALKDLGAGLYRADVDLTGCYAPELRLDQVVRTVWLARNDLVVVADRIAGGVVDSIAYHWHGHREAAWWVKDNVAQLVLPTGGIFVTSPQATFTEAQVDRLPGSKGELTLKVTLDSTGPVIWWIFARMGVKTQPPKVAAHGTTIHVNADVFLV